MTRLPVTRGECVNGPRPCPHTACRFHLADIAVVGAEQSCALDVADYGGATLEEIGAIMGVTKSTVQRVIEMGAKKLRARAPGWRRDLVDVAPAPGGRWTSGGV